MDTRWLMSRRALLGGVGLMGGSALLGGKAFGQAMSAPKRFIVVHVPEGMWSGAQRPTQGAASLGPLLSPLDPWKSRVAVINNLVTASRNNGPGPGGDDAHYRAVVHMLTGIEMADGGNAGGPSVDQAIAAYLAAQNAGAPRRFKSLQFGVRIVYRDLNSKCIWERANVSLPAMEDPWTAYSRIFSGVAEVPPHFPGVAPPPEQAPAPLPTPPKLDLRRSALDNALRETAALRARLGANDRVRLDSYQESLREIERRLAASWPAVDGGVDAGPPRDAGLPTDAGTPRDAGTDAGLPRDAGQPPVDAGSPGTPGCTLPTTGTSANAADESNYQRVGRLQMDLMVAALQCGLTQVASLQWGNSNDQAHYQWLFPGNGFVGHDFAHNNSNCDADSSKKVAVTNWYAQQFAYLVGKLAAIPEGAGSMLDNTVILWASEFGDCNGHSSANMMWTVLGNANGYLRTGQVLNANGRAVNDLHTTLCNAFGLGGTTFGNPAYCQGPLAGLRA